MSACSSSEHSSSAFLLRHRFSGCITSGSPVSFHPRISVVVEAFPAFKPPFPRAAGGRIQREESLISREKERQKVAGIQGDFPV